MMTVSLFCLQLSAQTQVTGTITEGSTSGPLPGASILEKGTTNGATSDFNGNFSITVSDPNAILQVSYIGFTTISYPLEGKTNVSISLTEDSQALDEVVVIGYGTQNKNDISGSVSSVSSEDIADLKVATIEQTLAAQSPGVVVSQASGAPGGGVSVQIRGTVSINSSSSPLYVIDGFPIVSDNNSLTTNPLNSFSPNDIESIQILKDASASAIYGSRAANGVVLITTKKGKAGKPTFNFDYYSGIQQVERKVDVLNASEFVNVFNESRNNGYRDLFGGNINDTNEQRRANGATSGSFLLFPESASSLGRGTDWQDEIFRTAPITSAQLSVSGGNEKTKFYLSGGYFNQDGVVINSGFERFNLISNINTKISKRVRLGSNLNISYTTTDLVPAEGSWQRGGVVTSALLFSPTIPVRDENGDFISNMGQVLPNTGILGQVFNPVQTATETQWTDENFRAISSLYVEFDIFNELTFKVLGGAEYASGVRERFSPSTLFSNVGGNTRQRDTRNRLNYLSEFTLNYNKSFGKHGLNILGGYSFQKEESLSTSFQSNNAPNDLTSDPGVGVFTDYISNPQEWSLLSFFTRLQYNYDRKYYLEGSIRRDGSSRFGSANRFGNFPSLSVAWRIGQENFLIDSGTVNELKLKASYGLTGNNGIGNYAALGTLSSSNTIYNGSLQQGLIRNTFPNEDLGWETTSQFNLGLEIGLFENRINLTAEVYDKRTKDLLLDLPLSDVTGSQFITSNIGEISNKGWEFALNTVNVRNDNFEWTTNFNISANRNKVEKLGGNGSPIFLNAGSSIPGGFIIEEGSPIGSFYGLVTDGIISNQEELDNVVDQSAIRGSQLFIGDLRLKDLDGDGLVTNENDRKIIGDTQADFIYGLTNNLKHKNIDLSILIQGSEGNQVINGLRRNIGNQAVFSNVYQDALTGSFRSAENPGNGRLPQVKRALASPTTAFSDYFVDDASFLRVRNITAGYTFSDDLVKRMGLSRLRCYVSVQNAFLFTDYVNYNPEVSASTSSNGNPLEPGRGNATPGVDPGSYPTPRTFTLGLNVSF